MTNQEIKTLGEKYVMNTYGRYPVALVRGEGTLVWDADGKEYLDFLGGIAVNALGHCAPEVTGALKEQADTLIHCSNLYWIEPQVQLARLLCENSVFDKVFFCNSGAEANEGAIKLARKYSELKYGPGRHTVLTMDNSFHGRTLATLTATGQPKFHKHFHPLPEGFSYAPFNDTAAFEEALTDDVCAVLLEPVQGEGGVFAADADFLSRVQELCRKKDILLILDEVQTGMGRTGHLFGYEAYGLTPDLMTLAKGLGGGVPIGAFLATEAVARAFSPGDHGSTFGGNPLNTRVGQAVLETMTAPGFLEGVREASSYFRRGLNVLKEKYSFIREIRGLGLMVGLDLTFPGAELTRQGFEEGLLFNCTNNTTLRFLPPLTISREEMDRALAILDSLFSKACPEEQEGK